MKHRFRLIAFDLDGTIVMNGNYISETALEAIQQLSDQGVIIVIATGRSYNMIPRRIKELPFLRYIICANGSVVIDCNSGNDIYNAYISHDRVIEARTVCKKAKAGLSVDVDNSSYFDMRYYRYMLMALGAKFMSLTIGRKINRSELRFHLRYSLKKIINQNKGRIQKLNILYKNEQSRDKQMTALLSVNDIEPVFVMGLSIEVTAKGVSKGAALELIGREADVTKEDILAFGDSGNDLSMREAAGTFVAMGNATDDVKSVADYTTETVEKDGVATAINKIVEKRVL